MVLNLSLRAGVSVVTAGVLAAALLSSSSATALSTGVGNQASLRMVSVSGTAPTTTTAMADALADDSRVEDLSQRTSTTSVYANPDGTWTSEQAAEPFRVETANAEWHDIDTTLVERDGMLEPRYAPTDLAFSEGGVRTFATMTEDDRDLTWQWPSALPAPKVDGDTATYPDVVKGGDLVLKATSTGFSHSIVLHDRPDDPVSFTMPVGLDGATLAESQTSGALTVKDPVGDSIVTAPQPMMWDSSQNQAGTPDNVAAVDAEVTHTPSGNTRLTLTPDENFLMDPETVYPVTIDPTYSYSDTPNGDTWLMNADFTGSQSISQELRAGTYDGGGHIARSMMIFTVGPVIGKQIISANLRLRNWDSGSCTSGAVRAYRISENWSMTGVTWSTQPAVSTTDYADFSPAYGYSGCPTNNANWDVTSIVSGWASGAYPNYGLRIRGASETSSATWRKYRSADYTPDPSLIPTLSVTYAAPPSAPTSLAVTPSRGSSTNSSVPTLSATLQDPSMSATFHLYDGQGAEIWTGGASSVSSAAVASVSLPPGILVDPGSYSFRVAATDGYGTSPLSSSTIFSFDIGASTVPAPTCSTGCSAVTETDLVAPGTVLQAGETRIVPVSAPGVDTTVIDLAMLKLTATNWSSSGSLTVTDPDYVSQEPPTLTYGPPASSSTGVTTTLQAVPSDSRTVKIVNSGSGAVTVALTIYAWTSWSSSDAPAGGCTAGSSPTETGACAADIVTEPADDSGQPVDDTSVPDLYASGIDSDDSLVDALTSNFASTSPFVDTPSQFYPETSADVTAVGQTAQETGTSGMYPDTHCDVDPYSCIPTIPATYRLPEMSSPSWTIYKEGEGNSKKTYTCAPSATRNMVSAMHKRLYGTYFDYGEHYFEVREGTLPSIGTSSENVVAALNEQQFHRYGSWRAIRPTSINNFVARIIQSTYKLHHPVPMAVETRPLDYKYYRIRNLHHFVTLYGYERAGGGFVYIADSFSYQYSYGHTPELGDVYGRHRVAASNAYHALMTLSYHKMVV